MQTLLNIRRWVKNDCLCYFEVPNLDIVLQKNIIEEFFIDKHLFHFSTECFINILNLAGFKPCDQGVYVDSENISVICRPSVKSSEPVKQVSNHEIHKKIELYYHQYNRNKIQIKSAVANLNGLIENKKIAFWGAGRIFEAFIRFGKLNPKKIPLVVDKYLSCYNLCYSGQKVLAPKTLINEKPEVIIVTSRTYYNEIVNEINSMQINAEVINFSDLLTDAKNG